jgi:hypothetical protein
MQIVIESPDSVKEYLAYFPHILGVVPRECPTCGGELKGHGKRQRWVVSHEGIFQVPIQRVICKVCRRTFSLLPQMLCPFYSCTRSLVSKIQSLWVRGVRKMAAVRYMLSVKAPFLLLPLSTLYYWATRI